MVSAAVGGSQSIQEVGAYQPWPEWECRNSGVNAMAEIQGSWLRRLWLVARTLVHSQPLPFPFYIHHTSYSTIPFINSANPCAGQMPSISYGSKKQAVVALSSTEAKYMALSLAAREVTWLRLLLTERGLLKPDQIFAEIRVHGSNKCVDGILIPAGKYQRPDKWGGNYLRTEKPSPNRRDSRSSSNYTIIFNFDHF